MHYLLMAVFLTQVVGMIAFEMRAKAESTRKEKIHRMVDTFWVTGAAAMVAFLEYTPLFSWIFGVIALVSIAWLVHGSTHQNRHPRMHTFNAVVRPVALINLIVLWPFINGVGLFMGLVLPFSTSGLKNIGIAYFAANALVWAVQVVGVARERKSVTPVAQLPAPDQQNAA